MKVSVIIPVFNEERSIDACLKSLSWQSFRDLEIIVVDDGSTDQSLEILRSMDIKNLEVLNQNHLGPGQARNLGAKKAQGEVLVFVDGDMEFDRDFIAKLVEPIVRGKTIGTFSRDEYLLNKSNIWARFWNLNLGRRADRMHPDNYPATQAVFRAILRTKFNEVGGFDTGVGYTDDWTISRKLEVLASVAPGAKFYHRNPENLKEVWQQARWFGKNEFLTKNMGRVVFNLVRYSFALSILKGVLGSIRYQSVKFLVFKIVYDGAVFVSVLRSILGEHKNK